MEFESTAYRTEVREGRIEMREREIREREREKAEADVEAEAISALRH